MIPLGPMTNAGAAADALDVVLLVGILSLVGIALAVDVAFVAGWLRRKP